MSAERFAHIEPSTDSRKGWEAWVGIYFLAQFDNRSACENYIAGINAAHDAAVKKAVKAEREMNCKIIAEAFRVGVPGAIIASAVVDVIRRKA